MDDIDLVRALTLDKAQNTDRFHQIASQTLTERGLDLAHFINQIQVRTPAGQRQGPLSVEQALGNLDAAAPLWQSWLFTHSLDQSLLLQRHPRYWLVSHYLDERYAHTCILGDYQTLIDLLRRFLQLQDWRPLAGPFHDLDAWPHLARATSRPYLEAVAAELDRAKVLYALQSPTEQTAKPPLLTLVVPQEQTPQAQEALNRFEHQVRQACDQALALADGPERQREVDLYRQLSRWMPDNPALFYNWGSALYELGRYEEAAAAFIEAVSRGLPESEKTVQLQTKSSPFGGYLGMIALLLKKLRPAGPPKPQAPPPYPDFLDDAELFLVRLLKKIPDPLKALHTLAAIASHKRDLESARHYYQQIAAIAPNDEVARTQLALLNTNP